MTALPAHVVLVALAVAVCTVTAPSVQERAALEDLYAATEGASWFINTRWLTGDSCSWFGIRCDSSTAVVYVSGASRPPHCVNTLYNIHVCALA